MSPTASLVLPQGAGYAVVIGIGLFFSGLMLGLTVLQKRYTAYNPSNTEEFSSASRSIRPGLIASGIVSAWTWAATLLQSSAVAYKYGISGPWWYGAGAMVQILLFAQLAAKLKLNAPNAHTWLEIVGTRWGTFAHCVFLFFGLVTNIIVSSMLILGGSATVTDLTGMDTIAAIFLIPLGVTIYVIVGGMRATLLCDYTHTPVLLTIILIFTLAVYATSPKIGSISAMHVLLTNASRVSPVPGNKDGSCILRIGLFGAVEPWVRPDWEVDVESRVITRMLLRLVTCWRSYHSRVAIYVELIEDELVLLVWVCALSGLALSMRSGIWKRTGAWSVALMSMRELRASLL